MSEHTHSKPVVAYDGTCAFCQAMVASWKSKTGSKVEYDPRLTKASKHIAVAMPGGTVATDARAVYTILSYSTMWAWLLPLYKHFAPFAWMSDVGYKIISRLRTPFLSPLTRALYGPKIEEPTYKKAHGLFYRLLGVIYMIAFLSLTVQIVGLVGTNGIMPIGDFQNYLKGQIGNAAYWQAPMLFWLGNSDMLLRAVTIIGALLAVPLVLGFAHPILLALLWAIYLSLTNAGQLFMAYQWDALLLEVGFLAIFMTRRNAAFRTLFTFLLFRLVFASGLVKIMSGDESWQSLTALQYHFFTQPLPTQLAWYAQQLPNNIKSALAVVLFAIELVAPFLILFPRRAKIVGAYAIILLQVGIILTGNYTFFNLLTIAIALLLLDDTHLARIPQAVHVRSITFIKKLPSNVVRAKRYATTFMVVVLATLGILRVTQFTPAVQQKLDMLVVAGNAFAPLRLTSSYGLFAVMTTTRPEVIIEASADGKTWEAYEFKYKPQDVAKAPSMVGPYLPRLDWQMWFVGLDAEALINLEGYQPTPQLVTPFLLQLGQKLLQDKPEVKQLMAKTPSFKPKYMRATVYLYRFSTAAERSETGAWWVREKLNVYLPQVTL